MTEVGISVPLIAQWLFNYVCVFVCVCVCVCDCVCVSASQLRVGEDRLTVTGDKGYCMVRATHGT